MCNRHVYTHVYRYVHRHVQSTCIWTRCLCKAYFAILCPAMHTYMSTSMSICISMQCKAQCWAVCPVTCACTCPYTCLYACKKMWIYAYAHGYANFDVSIEFHMCLHRGFVHTSVYMPMEISIQISKWIFIRVCVQKALQISAQFSFSCLRSMLKPDCMFIHMYIHVSMRMYIHMSIRMFNHISTRMQRHIFILDVRPDVDWRAIELTFLQGVVFTCRSRAVLSMRLRRKRMCRVAHLHMRIHMCTVRTRLYACEGMCIHMSKHMSANIYARKSIHISNLQCCSQG